MDQPSQDYPRIVVKLGGRALERPTGLAELAEELREWDPVVVHGGGAEVSEWCRRLGLTPASVEGLRVTDAATLEVATAVLAGLANKRLVATLRSLGVDAVGLSALDGGIIRTEAHPRSDRLGLVGTARSANPEVLQALFSVDRVPVVASIGACDGALLNLNADDVAAAIAGALQARALFLITDSPGVLLGNELVPEMSIDELNEVRNSEDVQGGMIPKLAAAGWALMNGAHEVYIAAWAGPHTLAGLLSGRVPGTRIAGSKRKAGAHV